MSDTVKRYELKDMRNAYEMEHVPMTPKQTEVFFMCTLLDMKEKDPMSEADAEILGSLGQIMYKRLQHHHKVPISKGLAAFTVQISDRPGTIVLWCFTYHEMWRKLNRMVTISDFANHFPMGIPTEKAIEQIWVAQKAYSNGEQSSRNLIDDEVNWR